MFSLVFFKYIYMAAATSTNWFRCKCITVKREKQCLTCRMQPKQKLTPLDFTLHTKMKYSFYKKDKINSVPSRFKKNKKEVRTLP